MFHTIKIKQRAAVLNLLLFCLVASTVHSTTAAEIDHWESVIYAEDTWRYFPATSEPHSNWFDINFDDSHWLQGPGGIGYDDGDDRTIIDPVISLYMRRVFDCVDTSAVAKAIFNMDYDDAFVAYVNGVEIARANIGEAGVVPPFDQFANAPREATMYSGGFPDYFVVNKSVLASLLNQGENVLAIQVHNQSATSSDMSSIPFLSFGITDASYNYRPTPDWFVEPLDFTSSNLPIFLINTDGKSIQNENRITARLDIKYNQDGSRNDVNQASDFQGQISIEIRGSSSSYFDKKSYGFETQDENGDNLNISLLDLPKENDWILYGPYSDKSLLRNAITFYLSRKMGRYASRIKFCELAINGDYQGVYILMEKIKRDKNRVFIDPLEPDENSGVELTGGYIIKVDKKEGDYRGWTSYSNPPGNPIFFQYYYPDHYTITPAQEDYIQNYILDFETALNSGNFRDPEKGYAPFIDMTSFIDMFIINELTKDIDGYRFSTYMYKKKDGPLVMGPFWDFNLGYGNVDYGNDRAMFTDGWMYSTSRMYWWPRMMRDITFKTELSNRWFDLRRRDFSTDNVMATLDSLATLIDEAQQRNYQRWPVLGTYLWPNYFIGDTWEEEVDFLKSWISDRLEWMDDNMPYPDDTRIEKIVVDDKEFETASPNPFRSFSVIRYRLETNGSSTIKIYDVLGRIVKTVEQTQHNVGQFTARWDGTNSEGQRLPSGIYFYRVYQNNQILKSGKLIKQN